MGNIIGKIPGYNYRIDTPNSGVDYTTKLLHNINRVKFTPTGYTVNVDSATSNKGINIYTIGAQTNTSTGGNFASSALDTWTALKVWEGVAANSGCGSYSKGEINILSTNDSTFSENLSNDYQDSFLDSATNGISQSIKDLIGSVNQVLKAYTGFDADAGRSLMRKTTTGNSIVDMLSGKALGFQTTLPKEWKTSNYNSGLQLMVKLVSPSGHPTDIVEYVFEPLKCLLAMTAPITYNGITYGYPPLWRVVAEGMQTVNVGAITNLTLTRGGNETQFNFQNEPLSVDVRLTIESIINGYTSFGEKMDESHGKYNTTMNRNTLITNHQDMTTSFSSGNPIPNVIVKL